MYIPQGVDTLRVPAQLVDDIQVINESFISIEPSDRRVITLVTELSPQQALVELRFRRHFCVGLFVF